MTEASFKPDSFPCETSQAFLTRQAVAVLAQATLHAPIKKPSKKTVFELVRRAGLEPASRLGQGILSPSCIPIPPPAQVFVKFV